MLDGGCRLGLSVENISEDVERRTEVVPLARPVVQAVSEDASFARPVSENKRQT